MWIPSFDRIFHLFCHTLSLCVDYIYFFLNNNLHSAAIESFFKNNLVHYSQWKFILNCVMIWYCQHSYSCAMKPTNIIFDMSHFRRPSFGFARILHWCSMSLDECCIEYRTRHLFETFEKYSFFKTFYSIRWVLIRFN